MAYTPTIADTNRTSVRYIEEITPGTTPANPALQELRITGESLDYELTNTQSQEIRSDRQISDLITTGAQVSGSVNFEASYGSFEPLFNAALMAEPRIAYVPVADAAITWTLSTKKFAFTNTAPAVLKGQLIKVNSDNNALNGVYIAESSDATGFVVSSRFDGATLPANGTGTGKVIVARTTRNGTTRRAFTFQKAFTDIDDVYNYRGVEMSKLDLNVAQGAILTGAFEVMGRSSENGEIAGQTVLPQSQTPVLNAVNNIENIRIGDTVYSSGVQSATFSIDNALRAQAQIGSLALAGIGAGTANVTMTMVLYLSGPEIYNLYTNSTYTSFGFSVSDALGNSAYFNFPRIKLSKATVNAGAINQDVVLNVESQAIASTGADSHTIQVSYFDAE